MIELNIPQGTPAWHVARAGTNNASEAPAMMGVGKRCARSELLFMKKTGITPDVSEWAQRFLFDKGHEVEAEVRRMVEQNILGEDLYPVVATDDTGRFLASSDGATMLYDVGLEVKLWNEETAEAVRAGQVPEYHAWQLDQQIAIFAFEKIIFAVSDGTPERFVWCEYRTAPERIARLMAGWEQFEKDLAAYVPEASAPAAPVGRAPENLPALRIEVTGMVTASNLAQFKEHALAVFAGIKTDLQTDADFADAEKTVKWCGDVESRLEAAKSHALSQTASIDELFRTIDAIKAEARAKRLELEKLVKSEKESRRLQIVMRAHQALYDHIAALNVRLGGSLVPAVGPGPFGDAVKGLKSLDSMRAKVDASLASAKIVASEIADRIDANRKTVEDMSLVPDFATVCTKAPEDFAALLAMRINARKDAEDRKLEAERQRIRAEEQAKAQREAQEAAKREADAKFATELQAQKEARREAEKTPPPASIAAPVSTAAIQQPAPAKPAPAPENNGKTITLGQINAKLAPIQISAAGLAELGIQPAGRDRSAVLYRESDVVRICDAMVRHLSAVSGQFNQPA